jgi:hypothetical protein
LGEEETVHKYLNKNIMARFIPKRFTWNKDHPKYEKSAWIKFKSLRVRVRELKTKKDPSTARSRK